MGYKWGAARVLAARNLGFIGIQNAECIPSSWAPLDLLSSVCTSGRLPIRASQQQCVKILFFPVSALLWVRTSWGMTSLCWLFIQHPRSDSSPRGSNTMSTRYKSPYRNTYRANTQNMFICCLCLLVPFPACL